MNQRIEELYRTIRQAKEEIEAIRSKCKHEDTSEYPYQWWDHYITMADVCDECGKALREKGPWQPEGRMSTFGKKEEK